MADDSAWGELGGKFRSDARRYWREVVLGEGKKVSSEGYRIRENAYNWPAFSKASAKSRKRSNFCPGVMLHSDVHFSIDSGVIWRSSTLSRDEACRTRVS